MLPDYIAKAVPNAQSNRAPWYKNTAPSYAGTFLWIAFYSAIGLGTLTRAPLSLLLLGLAAAGVLCYMFYYVPAMLGMKTGYPLYVIASSTFGAKGGYAMPGLLMGVLQVGWFAVGTMFATKFVLSAFGSQAGPGTLPFILVGVVWALGMGFVGVQGIKYVARVALLLNSIPLLMLIIVFAKTSPGLAQSQVTDPAPYVGVTLIIQMVVGFFATAGAAGADFGMSSRDARDVKWGGLTGIALAVLIAGGLGLLAVAGAMATIPGLSSYTFESVIGGIGGWLASAMFFLFIIASIPPSCFCAFIIGNCFATMLPSVSRMVSTMVGVTIAAILAVTGVTQNLIGIFTIVGASFGPVCGAMTADYLLSGGQWKGPREGINWAGYGAWAAGFIVGILTFIPGLEGLKDSVQPLAVWSFVVGFVVYAILAKAGLESKTVPMAK
ncbi:MAG TPA: cytosine permease [Bryobacteraceae bacterium]|nr:cytosine permease [Bryobacteraceae bacterium]